MRQSKSLILKLGLYIITLAVLVYVIVFMPTPYMINRPGTAEEIKPMVSIPAGDPEEEGTFMLTTVSVSYANIAMLATSPFQSHTEVVRKEPDRDEKEYQTQQHYYMNNSQSNAIMAAYYLAGVRYDIVPEYVFVVGLSKNSPPKGDFQPGDIVSAIDGVTVKRFEELSGLLKDKESGDRVEVELQRNGKIVRQQVELVELGEGNVGKKAGLGVTVGEVRKVVPEDKNFEVEFADTRIGGPSAGLMFALEIYNQLTPGDLTRGYRIAGTGTITDEGAVGPIGGVQFKVVASHREGAEIFFVPQDNYKDAKAKAEEIKSDMKLVPVKHAEDALRYLQELPLKEGQ